MGQLGIEFMNHEWVDTARELILQEAQYLSSTQQEGLALALALTTQRCGRQGQVDFLELALENLAHAIEYRLDYEHLLCTCLYYGYLLSAIPENEIAVFGPTVQPYLRSLVDLATHFEDSLPWVSAGFSGAAEDHARKPFWVEKSRALKPEAFLGMAYTPEIAIIKLIERLQLLKLFPKLDLGAEVDRHIAQESLDLHSMVAEILGVWLIKSRIDDYAFKVLMPDIYASIVLDLAEQDAERQARIDRAKEIIARQLVAAGINATIDGRPKHIYGLYHKIRQTNQSVREVNDNLGVRVIVGGDFDLYLSAEAEARNIQQCYEVRNLLFQTWPSADSVYPNSNLYRDFISHPKPNGYQSIHITVVFEGRLLEVQIRSKAMHDIAEYGAAAHWVYKKTGRSDALKGKYAHYVTRVRHLRFMLESSLRK